VPRAGRRSEAWLAGTDEFVAEVDAGTDDDEAAEVDAGTDDDEAAEVDAGADDDAEDADDSVLLAVDVGAGAVVVVVVVVMSNAGACCALFSRLAHDQAVTLAVVIAKEYVPEPATARVTSARAQVWAVIAPVAPTGAAAALGASVHVIVRSSQPFDTGRRDAPSGLLEPAQQRNTARVITSPTGTDTANRKYPFVLG